MLGVHISVRDGKQRFSMTYFRLSQTENIMLGVHISVTDGKQRFSMTYFRLSQTENITNQLYTNMYCKLQ